MRAAANTPVAVASSSAASPTVNNNASRPADLAHAKPTRMHPSIWMPTQQHPPHSPNSTHPPHPPANTMRPATSSFEPGQAPGFPPGRATKSASDPNSRAQQLNNNAGSRASNTSTQGTDHYVGQVSSPRRRRPPADTPHTPRHAQAAHVAHVAPVSPAAQAAQAPQAALDAQTAQTEPEQLQPGRILVTGYPTYTQPHDLIDVFQKFGNVHLEKCNTFSATLSYTMEEQAKKAISNNKRLHIYGHFLTVRPYSAKLKSEEGVQSPKRDFTKTKQKSVIIEPAKIDLTGTFHSQLDKIMAAIRLNQNEIAKISTLYSDIEEAFEVQWPGCKAIPFGSITTGLGIKTSDADCFVSLPPQYRHAHGNHVNRARRLLAQQPHKFAEILAIPRANTPIVKFYHVPTDINCDLTFKTPLGAQNSRLISFLLGRDPRVTPAAVVVKYWAKVHELSGTGRLTNYALTMLLLFYLQQPPRRLLPPVRRLQQRAHRVVVDCWDTGFSADLGSPPTTATTSAGDFTIAELLGGFFEYYSMFNFDEMVVCPYLGVPIKKEAFMDTKSLPEEFRLYKDNVLNNYVMPIRYQTPFCVQDPFEQCHNVASTITSRLALDIKTFFKFAANAYEQDKANGCTGFLKTILLEKPKLIRGKTHPEYRVNLFPRIINTIIDFDWKSVVRRLVKTIFEKMMKIPLGKVEEKVNPDSRKEKEKYMGNLTKQIWKRKKYNSMYTSSELGIEERQSLISEELLKNEVQPVSLQFQLCLTFCHDPKSAVISIRMGGGDLDAFREFGKFFISIMQSWFTQLLKPHSMPNCKDTAAKIAETVDGDSNANDVESNGDDEEIVLTPTPKRNRDENAADEKTSVNISEVFAVNDASQDGADNVQVACDNE